MSACSLNHAARTMVGPDGNADQGGFLIHAGWIAQAHSKSGGPGQAGTAVPSAKYRKADRFSYCVSMSRSRAKKETRELPVRGL